MPHGNEDSLNLIAPLPKRILKYIYQPYPLFLSHVLFLLLTKKKTRNIATIMPCIIARVSKINSLNVNSTIFSQRNIQNILNGNQIFLA
ncbi:hypothetical protein CD57_15820 [Vibrio cholerae O1 biovar El Tor]|nr:hypothetical protein CD57_15820 [Vibrio cholerae O1 biovar El Tor]